MKTKSKNHQNKKRNDLKMKTMKKQSKNHPNKKRNELKMKIMKKNLVRRCRRRSPPSPTACNSGLGSAAVAAARRRRLKKSK